MSDSMIFATRWATAATSFQLAESTPFPVAAPVIEDRDLVINTLVMLGRAAYGVEVSFERFRAAQKLLVDSDEPLARLEHYYAENLEAQTFLGQASFFFKLLGVLKGAIPGYEMPDAYSQLKQAEIEAWVGRAGFEHWHQNVEKGFRESHDTAEQFLEAAGIVQGDTVQLGTRRVNLREIRDAIRAFSDEKVVPRMTLTVEVTRADGSKDAPQTFALEPDWAPPTPGTPRSPRPSTSTATCSRRASTPTERAWTSISAEHADPGVVS